MKYYSNIDASGNGYRVRLKLGIHQTYSTTFADIDEAAFQADLLKAWLRATLPDVVAEKYESQISQPSTPHDKQTPQYHALLATVNRSADSWVEQIKTAPEWIARLISRVYKTYKYEVDDYPTAETNPTDE